MKVNRLGKVIIEDLGYSGVKEFIVKNNLKVNFNTIYAWCTKKSSTPNLKSYIHIDAVANVLGVSRIEVLNMIATKAEFDVTPVKKSAEPNKPVKVVEDNFLKAKRKELGFKQYELAELIGCDNAQVLCDLENGKRLNFPNSDILKNYLEALDISFSQFQSALKELREKDNTPSADTDTYVFDAFGNEIQPVTLVEDNEKTVAYETVKSPITATDKEKIMSLIYGQVDFETFKAVEKVLRGAV